jgi:hypothetical protein
VGDINVTVTGVRRVDNSLCNILLSRKNIDEAHSLLEKLCKNKGFLFLDNTSTFLKYDELLM